MIELTKQYSGQTRRLNCVLSGGLAWISPRQGSNDNTCCVLVQSSPAYPVTDSGCGNGKGINSG